MSSQRRIDSSRANGAKSRGPVTPEGKLRSSRNAIRHGLLAEQVAIGVESPEGFANELEQFEHRIQPIDDVETAIVEDMTLASWRLRRIYATEKIWLDEAIDCAPGNGPEILGAAMRNLFNQPEFSLLQRYETRLHRIFTRSLHDLRDLRRICPSDEPTVPRDESVPPADSPSTLPPDAPHTANDVHLIQKDSQLPPPAKKNWPNEPSPISGHPAPLPQTPTHPASTPPLATPSPEPVRY
jgi:hypothetical protein